MERNEAVFFKKDRNTTVCGIPAASRDHYFAVDEPALTQFFMGGWKYLAVYEINEPNTIVKKGGVLC